jgi:hypothetical protein
MMNYKLWLSALMITTIFACGVADDVEDLKNDLGDFDFVITNYNTEVGIYDTLLIRGSFAEDLPEPIITISGDSSFELDFVKVSTTELHTFIPKNVTAGDYELTFTVGDKEIKESLSGEAMMITMQDRPLVTEISSNTFAAGTEITVTGGPFVNTSDNNGNDATVWFQKIGSSNSVSDITVNAAGDEATILVDSDLDPGVYKFYITVDESTTYYTEWSNLVMVTVE